MLLFFFEAFFLYTYYYGWGKFRPVMHLFLGLGLNLIGTAIMFIANAWLTFMTTPAGISESGRRDQHLGRGAQLHLDADQHPPHHRQRRLRRLGGRGLRRLQVPAGAKTDEERAHYDWMGYIGNFVAICAFLPLPFAGYWLASRDLRLLPDPGHHHDGRRLLLALHHPGGADRQPLPRAPTTTCGWGWAGSRAPQRFQGYIKYLLIVIALCFAIWATPRSIIATVSEIRAMGGVVAPAARLPRA